MPEKELNWLEFSDLMWSLFINAPAERPALSPESQKLLRSNALDWTVSRRRLLLTAIRTLDFEQFRLIFDEYIAVNGHQNAFNVVMKIMENATREELELTEEELEPPSPL
jgi:hypothetical protein